MILYESITIHLHNQLPISSTETAMAKAVCREEREVIKQQKHCFFDRLPIVKTITVMD